jgi:dTMP kinase
MQGKLIVFEGGEGSGKTTQIRRSHDWLRTSSLLHQLQQRNYISDVLVTREPGGTELSQSIRQLLLNHTPSEPMQDRTELLLYAADRAQHVEYCLKPQLEKGMLILCDRYVDSTIAYQGYGRGLDGTLIDQLNHIATNGLESDLTLWLDIDVEVGLARTQKRGASDRIEQSSLDFHQRVRQGFTDLAQSHPHCMIRIDASQSEDQVAQQIQSVLQHHLVAWYGKLE